jgi:hypothetical protein
MYPSNYAATTRETTELDREPCLTGRSTVDSLLLAVSAFSRSFSITEICLDPRRGGGDSDVISGESGKGSGAGGQSGLRGRGSGSGSRDDKDR